MSSVRDVIERPPRAVLLAGMLVMIVGVSLALRVAPYQMDDAFIFFRYAAHIAAGDGPTYNVGAPAVEGFTSPLWTLVLAAFAKLLGAAPLPLIAMACGTVAYGVCVELLLRLGRPSGPVPTLLGNVACLLPAALWALSPGATYYAVTGMETLLFLSVVLAVHGAATGALNPWVGMLAAVLAVWARPEGGWLPVAVVAQLATQGALASKGRRPGLMLLGGLIIGGMALLVWREATFHDVLPNTFYAKRPSRELGLQYLHSAIHTPWCLAIILAGVIGAVVGGPPHRGFLAAGLAWLAAAVLEGGDWMPAFRLLQPALALFALASSGVGQWVGTASRPWMPRALLVLVAAVAPLEVSAAVERGDTALRSLHDQRLGARALAQWLKLSGAQSVALIDIGEVGFADDSATIVDLAGLTDRQIAHAAGRHLRKQIDPGYVIDERRPDLIILRLRNLPERGTDGMLAPRPEDSLSQIEGDLLYDARLRRRYKPLFVQSPTVVHDPLYARVVFVRNDFHVPPEAVPPSDIVMVPDE